VANQEKDQDSALNFARRFIAWRRGQPQLTRGDIAFFDAPEPVLALRRDLEGEPGVLAAFNLSDKAVSFDWPASNQAADLNGHDLPGAAGNGRVTLPAYGAWFGTASNGKAR
jgi:alpha-glucosidase